ncbi:hypothetical protein T484DRAFT_1855854 [Baffinella frigidus]|nr:hypothetical protein T484DRAFT_1855854 [Cryptophyta sp. CCMP2293]
MQCNRRECGETLAGQEFVVTVCGHAFCSACQVETLERACCEACGQGLTDDDVEVCSPIPRGNAGSLALCGHDVNTILAIAARAITFAEGQQQLRYARAQETSEDLARRNSKLSSALMEMQAKQATRV